ncbi:hypothetical protein BHE74_00006620 [Ensete ventricosum]|nr:hypothetical protein BHE74_00006620 [Ensete ventricosum]
MLDNAQESVKRFGPPASRLVTPESRILCVVLALSCVDANQASYPRNFPAVEHGEVGSNNVAKENTHQKLIPLEGCSTSEAVKFLTERWTAAVHQLDDSSADVSGELCAPAFYDYLNIVHLYFVE